MKIKIVLFLLAVSFIAAFCAYLNNKNSLVKDITPVENETIIGEKGLDEIKIENKDKENKIKPYFSKYDRWWLLLVDHMNFMKSEDRVDIVKNITKPSCFDRIIVINYEGSSQFLDLKFS